MATTVKQRNEKVLSDNKNNNSIDNILNPQQEQALDLLPSPSRKIPWIPTTSLSYGSQLGGCLNYFKINNNNNNNGDDSLFQT